MALLDPDDDLIALAAALRPGLLRVSRQLRREAQKAGVSALDAQLLAHIFKHPGITAGAVAEADEGGGDATVAAAVTGADEAEESAGGRRRRRRNTRGSAGQPGAADPGARTASG